MIPEFIRDDDWQHHLAVAVLDPFYRSRGWQVERYPGDHPMQRLHVDVTLGKADKRHRIDEKIIRGRRDGRPATKISLETRSCSVPGRERPGWIAREEPSEATVLLVCNSDVADLGPAAWRAVTELDCVWIPFNPLREWFWQQGEEHWEAQDNGQANHSLSRKVPISEILRAIPGARRFLVELHQEEVMRAAAIVKCVAAIVARYQAAHP
jgi:hypothetical protein